MIVNRSTRMAPRLLSTAVASAALALALASPASAHAGVEATDPEDGATLSEAPAAVSVTFSETVDGPSTEVAVTGPDGAALELEDPVFEGATITQPMLYIQPGTYVLTYDMVSEDGHQIDGTLTFTVESVPTPESASDTPSASSDSAPALVSDSTAPAAAEDTDEGTDTGVVLASLLLLALLVGGAIAAAVQVRRRRARDH